MSIFANHQVRIHVCPSCDLRTEFQSHTHEEYPTCWYCGHELSTQPTSYRDPYYVTVAVYDMSRSYGGPEEGGWWYWEYDLIRGTQRSFLAEDAPQAEVYKDTLLHRYNSEMNPKYSHEAKVAVRCFAEDEAPKHLPLSRPHYC